MPGSSWGTFTIACTIPIALFVGWYMYRFRKGKVVEASLLGAVGRAGGDGRRGLDPRLAARAATSRCRATRRSPPSPPTASSPSVLPVWLLLCPRDYLSSFLKIGTIALLVVGVIVANPTLEAPAVNPHFADGRRARTSTARSSPTSSSASCAARSRASTRWSSSGTTPKMVDKEADIRMIGYGAMLMEGLVGVVALIAAAALPNSMYYDINIDLASRPDVPRQQLKFAHGGRPRRRRGRPPRASWSRWSRTSRSRSTAGPAAR